jgi:hypothetical protein
VPGLEMCQLVHPDGVRDGFSRARRVVPTFAPGKSIAIQLACPHVGTITTSEQCLIRAGGAESIVAEFGET